MCVVLHIVVVCGGCLVVWEVVVLVPRGVCGGCRCGRLLLCWCLEMCDDDCVVADALGFGCLFGEGLGGLVGGWK